MKSCDERLEEKAQEIIAKRHSFQEKAKEIMADGDLKPEAQRRQLEELRTEADAVHEKLVSEFNGHRQSLERLLRRQAFGVASGVQPTEAQKAQVHLAGRQALDRARATKSPEELGRQWRDALDSGDALASGAIVKVAYERGDRGILEELAEISPETAENLLGLDGFRRKWCEDAMDADRKLVVRTITSPPSIE